MVAHVEQFRDETIQCVSCSQTFAFTVRDQEMFERKGYHNKPKRCPTCRRQRNHRSTEEIRPSDADTLRELCKAVGETRIMIEREFYRINQRIDQLTEPNNDQAQEAD